MQTSTKKLIKNIYLYLVSFVTLMMIIIPTADIVSNILETYVFKKADLHSYKTPAPLGCGPEIAKTNSDIKKLSAEECKKLEEKNKKEEKERAIGNRHRDYAQDISLLVVAIPLFLIHQHYARRKEE
jgi:hypothetical protein